MKKPIGKPGHKAVILTIDDDEDINRLIEHRLTAMGYESYSCTHADEFFRLFDEKKPKLCIIDMHLQQELMGLKILEEISKKSRNMEYKPHIVVLSSLEDHRLIAYAIERGADDYWLKPLNRFHFQERVARYFNSDEQNKRDEPTLRAVPEEHQAIKLTFSAELVEINEFGVKLLGPDLLTKGSFLYLGGKEIQEATKKNSAVPVNVTSNWVDARTNLFCAMAEFDYMDEELIKNVRLWLSAQKERKKF